MSVLVNHKVLQDGPNAIQIAFSEIHVKMLDAGLFS